MPFQDEDKSFVEVLAEPDVDTISKLQAELDDKNRVRYEKYENNQIKCKSQSCRMGWVGISDLRDQEKQRLLDNSFHGGWEKLILVDVLYSEFKALQNDIKKSRI